MNKLAFFLILANLSLMAPSYSDSIQLYNDSPYKLTAVIVNAMNDIVGNVTLDSGTLQYWYLENSNILLQYNSTYVPFTVIWYCQEGKEYGIWPIATPGSRVSPQLSEGPKICKMKRVDERIAEYEQLPNPVIVK